MTNRPALLALVTGGGSGIGYATAAILADEGYRVAITGRSEKQLRQAADAMDGGILWRTCDVADRSDVSRLFAWLEHEHRLPDTLINSAGIKVTNIYPGETNTPIVDRRPEPLSPS